MLWVHGGKLCTLLGFKNTTQAIGMHVDGEDKQRVDIGSLQDSWFVSEPGMWSLILASKTQQAKDFKRWLAKTALPQIRKNGYYLDPNATIPQLEAMAKEIQHHKNWTPEQFLACLKEDQDDRKALWEGF